jgi:hypothetical protein
MKWTYVVQQKLKVALLLTAIMALVGLTNFLERRNIEKMDATFSSIYHDRLIPATDIFYMTENLFNRRLLIEQFLYTDNNGISMDALSSKLDTHEASINKLVDKFSKTLLVKDESVELNNFKAGLKNYDKHEQEILHAYNTQSRAAAQNVYEQVGRKQLLDTIKHLEELTEIQSTEGLAMMHGSQDIASNSSLLLTLQIVVAIFIGIMIQALIMASNTTNTTGKHFHLN